tara:strand:- start:534 stop:1214 length:681 start_codon:yes stop_codon:yes gene_type:complete
MIIGNGLVASEFKKYAEDYEDCIVFAAGVSSSSETNEDEFTREKQLLTQTLDKHKDLKFIYFSTILVSFADNDYYRHKAEMEKLIENTSSSYLIFRVPQLVGLNGNKDNLINYFKNNIQDNKTITIYEGVKRSFLDIEDVSKIVYYCKEKANRTIIKVSGIEKVTAIDLCKRIGRILAKSPKIIISASDEVAGWEDEESALYSAAITNLEIKQKGYTQRILEKYLK